MDEAIAALPRVFALDRTKVRRRFEQRFSATRMAKDYFGVYRSLLASRSPGSEDHDTKRRSPNGKDASESRPHIA